jgi:hypothetical protein
MSRPFLFFAPDREASDLHATDVIPAEAGIHRSGRHSGLDVAGTSTCAMDPGFRRDDVASRMATEPTPYFRLIKKSGDGRHRAGHDD